VTDAARSALERSQAYRLFSEAFAYPEGALLERIRDGSLARELGIAPGAADDSLPVEYTRLFDVGPSGPPCPLHGGLWIGDRMRSLEEVLRFYQHFDLALDPASGELPDHLAVELEFLHFLAFCQAEAWRDGADPGPYRRAEHDFLARHPARWLPLLRAALEKEQATPFYVALARALESLLSRACAEVA
jgi:DMSO reductase family type II enzyme chaperone